MKRAPRYREVRLEDIPTDDDPPPKKVHVDYKNLIVPPRMRSSYWKYFGFPADENNRMITKDVIVCLLCNGQMVYNRNTSNLKMHLGSRHRNALLAVETEEVTEESENERKSRTSIKNISDTNASVEVDPLNKSEEQMIIAEDIYDTDIAIIFPSKEEMAQYEQSKSTCDLVDSYEINDAIMNFLITDLVSPKIVEGRGFRRFISFLTNKTHAIPSERKITEDIIPNLYRRHKDRVYETILSNGAHNISLSLEQWTCADNSPCLSVYVHYLSDKGSVLNSKLLTSLSFSGSESAQHWSNYLDCLFNEWNINVDCISAVLVAFHSEELKLALKMKNILLLPCFLFLMQTICSEHCFKHPEVFELLEKCRCLIKYIQENKVDLAEDEDEFVDADSDENDFVLSCDQPEMWLTSYYMLRGLVRRKHAIINFLAIKSFDNPFSSTDWKNLLQLVKCLEPLKTVLLTLFEEKSSSISLIKPLIEQVCCNKFAIGQYDSTLIRQLKNDILSALNEAYEAEDINDFIEIASALDPRFKAFIEEDDAGVENKFVSLLSILVDEQGLCSRSDLAKKQSKPSGINALFGTGSFGVEKQEPSTEAAIKKEIAAYRSESSALLEECPLEWWQGVKKKCPNLIKLAHRYLCVPAVTTMGAQLHPKDYVTFCSQRAMLPVHIADSLLFLNINK